MSSDQASGLRQWSRSHAAGGDARVAPVELVVMTRQGNNKALERLVSSLALPEGVSRWHPRELALSTSQPDTVPASPWWVLYLAQIESRSASKLAEALRVLHRAGMPTTVLLTAPESTWVSGLVRAARDHLGVRLVQDQQVWREAVMAASEGGSR